MTSLCRLRGTEPQFQLGLVAASWRLLFLSFFDFHNIKLILASGEQRQNLIPRTYSSSILCTILWFWRCCVVILETLFGFYFTHTIQTSVNVRILLLIIVLCTMYLPCSSYGSSLCGLHNQCIILSYVDIKTSCYQSINIQIIR